MKNLVSGIAIALLLGAIYSTPIQAQTYDGTTPAQEAVCDGLKDDGITKGLYGLCVAYCEAQDTTYEEMDTVSNPDDQILAVYNKRKKETDPPMPCTVPLPSECPCFDQAFVDQIDGILDESYLPATFNFCNDLSDDQDTDTYIEAYACETSPGTNSGCVFNTNVEGRAARADIIQAPNKLNVTTRVLSCRANISGYPPDVHGVHPQRFMRVITSNDEENPLTEEQWRACAALASKAPVCPN